MSLKLHYQGKLMRADRLLAIVMRLQACPSLTTHELAQELGVARRTILRDIDALSTAGFPIMTQSGVGGGVSLHEHYRLALHGFHEAEIRALFLSGNSRLITELGLGAALETMRTKLFAALPTSHQHAVQRLQTAIHIDPTWWNDHPPPPLIPTLIEAITGQRRLAIIYAPPDGAPTQRLLHPYGLVAKAGAWYLVAERDGMLRTYRVARIQSAVVRQDGFERQADFDLATFWAQQAHTFFETLLQYRYTLQVRREALDLLQRYHTGRYRIEAAPVTAPWVQVDLDAEGLEPAMMLVFGLGANCRVVAPPELLEAMIERSALYQTPQ